jgi:hypothetical protein
LHRRLVFTALVAENGSESVTRNCATLVFPRFSVGTAWSTFNKVVTTVFNFKVFDHVNLTTVTGCTTSDGVSVCAKPQFGRITNTQC